MNTLFLFPLFTWIRTFKDSSFNIIVETILKDIFKSVFVFPIDIIGFCSKFF